MTKMEYERHRRGWNQTELAFRSKVSVADISKIERGWMKPFPGYAKRLSKALGISADELTKEVDVNESGKIVN
jgi:ribosome-binding protein aMBF1 (putative translation factor)